MTKRLKKALTILALAFVVSTLGLVSGAAFEAAIASDQVRADCGGEKCDGIDKCRLTANVTGCDIDPGFTCITYECPLE